MRQIAEPGPAEFLLNRDAEQAEAAHLRPQVPRKSIVAVDRVGAWRNTVLCKIMHALAQCIDVGAEPEIKPAPGIGNHGAPLGPVDSVVSPRPAHVSRSSRRRSVIRAGFRRASAQPRFYQRW
jgi:hypothetical protein